MTEHVDSLVLELLRAIRADISDLKRDVTGNPVQIAALGQQLAGLTGTLGPNWLLVLLMGLMGLLTNFVSNNAAAAMRMASRSLSAEIRPNVRSTAVSTPPGMV